MLAHPDLRAALLRQADMCGYAPLRGQDPARGQDCLPTSLYALFSRPFVFVPLQKHVLQPLTQRAHALDMP